MMKSETSIYELALCFIDLVGPVISRTLVDRIGSAEGVFKERRSLLTQLPNIGAERARTITSKAVLEKAEQELRYIEDHKINAIFYTSSSFPRRLLHCPDAPVILFVKGSASLNPEHSIALVGTRNQSTYGEQATQRIVKDCAPFQPTVVSGLAHGVDTTAHKTCLQLGLNTIGVMGHGFNYTYPHSNKKLFWDIAEHGALVTEFPSSAKPDAQNFPKRNRIVAGMTDATVVIEAAHKGGALITGQLAASYNRDVFALPGRINDAYSAGCLNLIKNHEAHILTHSNDLIEALGWNVQAVSQVETQVALPIDLSTEEACVVSALRYGPLEVDKIGTATGKPVSQVFSLLTTLELRGIVKSLPGKCYTLIG